MKPFRIAGLAILALCATVALSGCETLGGWLTGATGPATPPVANSVDAAGHIGQALITLGDGYVKTAACNRACRDDVAAKSHELRTYLDNAIDAQAAGNSALVATALKAFNDHYGSLWTVLKGYGAAVPS
jgi:hypothetical protein